MDKYKLDNSEISGGIVAEAAVAFESHVRRPSRNIVVTKSKYGNLVFTDHQLKDIINESESSVRWSADEACAYFRSKRYEY